MAISPSRTYSLLPLNKKCPCGGRLFPKKTVRGSGEKHFECLACMTIYTLPPDIERERIRQEKLDCILQKRQAEERWLPFLEKELWYQQELFQSNPTVKQEKRIGKALREYRRHHLRVNRPLIAHFQAQIERSPGRPHGSTKKTDPMLSVLIAISVKSGMLTPSQVLDALQMEKSSNNYTRFIPTHVKEGERLIRELNLFPEDKLKKPNGDNSKVMLRKLRTFSLSVR